MAGCLPASQPSIYASIRASGRPRAAAAALRSPRHLRAHTAPVRAPAGDARPRRGRGVARSCPGSARVEARGRRCPGWVRSAPLAPLLLPPLLPAHRPSAEAAPAQAALGKVTRTLLSPGSHPRGQTLLRILFPAGLLALALRCAPLTPSWRTQLLPHLLPSLTSPSRLFPSWPGADFI